VRNPKVFLFDEPLSNLDAQLRAQMRLELKELRQRVPTTSIFVTHDQVEAMTLGDRIVVMKDGFMQQVGTPLELYRRPATRFVAGFIGSPSMNFLEMQLAAHDDCFAFSDPGFAFKIPSSRFASLGAYVGRPVCVGMRPQHVRLGSATNAGEIGLRGTVVVTEQLGDEQILVIRLGQDEFRIAGVDPDLTLPAGVEIEAAVATGNLHFFDGDGVRIHLAE
jgi:multiple sugar transport system ATP-binding protein